MSNELTQAALFETSHSVSEERERPRAATVVERTMAQFRRHGKTIPEADALARVKAFYRVR